MPDYTNRTGRDVTDDMLLRLRELEREVRRLSRSPGRSAIDRGDTGAVAAPLEGQTMIQYDDETANYYSNGSWRPFGSSNFAALDVSQVETLTFSSTAGGGGGGVISLAHNSGVTLLDYSTPSAPTFLNDGVYTMSFLLQTTGTVAAGQEVGVEFNPSYTGSVARMGLDIRYVGPTGGGTGTFHLVLPPVQWTAGDSIGLVGRTHSGSTVSFEMYSTFAPFQWIEQISVANS